MNIKLIYQLVGRVVIAGILVGISDGVVQVAV